jgi:hypothetical protein
MSVVAFAFIGIATLLVGIGCWTVGEHLVSWFRSNEEHLAAQEARGKWLKTIDKPHAYVTLALMVVFVVGALLAVSFFMGQGQ